MGENDDVVRRGFDLYSEYSSDGSPVGRDEKRRGRKCAFACTGGVRRLAIYRDNLNPAGSIAAD